MSHAVPLRQDAFLGGRLSLWQPASGYRSGADAVLLAAAVPARAGQSALDIGTGAGVAAACLAHRTGAGVIGLERDPLYAGLARRNGIETVLGDVAAMPETLKARRFDHVLTNPPFFDRTATTAAPDPLRERPRGEGTPLGIWIGAALRRVAPKGTLSILHRAERVPEILALLAGRDGSVALLPLQGREGRAAGRVILQWRQGSRAPFAILPPLVLHRGVHERDEDDHTAVAEAVLRRGDHLPMTATLGKN